MSRFRFRLLFLLLVLILLLASLVFGFLTYWLGAERPHAGPAGSGQGRAPLLHPAQLLVPGDRSLPGQADGCIPLNPFVLSTKGLLVEVDG
jgi:hypothetical protein